jgi:hypothetical protein
LLVLFVQIYVRDVDSFLCSFFCDSHSLFTFFTFSLLSSLFTGVREALEVLCAASEFERDDVCRVRRGEQRHIRERMRRITMQITSGHDAATNR